MPSGRTVPETENWSASHTVIVDPGVRPDNEIGTMPSAPTMSPPLSDVDIAGRPDADIPPIVTS